MVKLVFWGTPQFAVPSLALLLAQPDFEVVAVVTQPDKRRGRGNQLQPSPVKALALTHGLPVWQPKSVKKDPETLANLQATQADAFVVVAYGQILSEAILAMPRLGCVNGHGSILPNYRGAAPIQWGLVRGETETGITTMLMDKGMDTGAMLLKATTPISLLDNAQDVADRLSQLSADLLVETVLGLHQGTVQPIPQDDSQATYAPLIQKTDYGLDWHKPAIALHNQIRGFFPNCTALFRQEPCKIMATIPLGEAYWPQLPDEFQPLQTEWQSPTSPNPGEIVAVLKNWGAVVQTGDGALLLHQVQLPGKRPQSGWDFANGARVSVGERLE
jgi:methionyl-tRNA formyltransferase